MLIKMCKSKIHRATITESDIHYEGSIQIDQALMEEAGLRDYEVVLIGNINNGNRFETYVIPGLRHSGVIGLNGAAARLGKVGDKIIIMAMAWMDEKEASQLKPRFLRVDDHNKIISDRQLAPSL